MRVLVCGGRDFLDERLLDRVLYDALITGDEIIHGGARGADMLAHAWAGENGFRSITFPANWKAHGRAAGAIRNQRMLDEGKPDVVIAFRGGRGTADMISRARKAGIEVREITP